MNRDKTSIIPLDYMSIVLDGADQTAFGLPHFVSITKDTKGYALKVKPIRLIENGVDYRVALNTMMENFETGANHIIECLYMFHNKRNGQIGLPWIFISSLITPQVITRTYTSSPTGRLLSVAVCSLKYMDLFYQSKSCSQTLTN